MNAPTEPRRAGRTGFRFQLLAAMMVVVSTITAVGLYVAQHNLAAAVARELQSQFQSELAALHNVQEIRQAALVERCRALVRKPRIHAALEDNALDLLYPSAKDELRDITLEGRVPVDSAAHALQADFYRFLDLKGGVISPPNIAEVGELSPAEEARLALHGVPREQQLGYLVRHTGPDTQAVTEVLSVPIISTETDEPIAALALGFRPVVLGGRRTSDGMTSGIWVEGRLHLDSLPESVQQQVGIEVSRAILGSTAGENRLKLDVDGVPHLVFFNRLNPDSLYSPAYEVCLFSLVDLLARQRALRWQIVGAGTIMILVGFAASHFFSARLSVPVEKLAVDSAVNREGRERAESALEQTNVELQRSIRFSSDASHQLKTPVTVLRAGLEELLARENLTVEVREEISELVHQTYRLTGVIEDLLLLSRMDAGRLRLAIAPVDLSRLIEAELDDLGAHPETVDLNLEPDVPAALLIAGEMRYTTLIVRNLLENARKYNRPGGRIRVATTTDAGEVVLAIGNTGRSIDPAAQEHIFERFHRGTAGENVPGHGLGLNLARELARLHGGDVRLVRSGDDWTEFKVWFRLANSASMAGPGLT